MTDTKGIDVLAQPLSALERDLLDIVQAHFPIEHDPYQALADQLRPLGHEVDGDRLFETVQELKKRRVIRRLGAIFDAAHLGYSSALCAIAVPQPDDVDAVAQLINGYHNVTHNYERQNYYNIWFTLIAPSVFDIKVILSEIAERTGYRDILYLPTLRLFKIRVDFKVGSRRSQAPVSSAPTSSERALGEIATSMPRTVIEPGRIVPEKLSSLDQAIVRELQKDLSAHRYPFAFVAQATHGVEGYQVQERAILQRVRNFIFNKTIRRFGAAVSHHRMGFSHNAMCVWNADERDVVLVGTTLAQHPEVSHCYQRPRTPTWNANLYTMVHGQSEQDCLDAVARMRADLDKLELHQPIDQPQLLYSTREFKKVSMRYFMEGQVST